MRLLLVLWLCCSWAWAWAEDAPQGFVAKYRLSRDGLPVGETRIDLDVSADGSYRYSAFTTPNMLTSLWRDGVVEESSRGHLVDGRPRPRRYSYRRSGDRPRTLEIFFDWSAGRLRVTSDGGGWTAPLPPGTLDKLVQQWALSRDLVRRKVPPAAGSVVRYQVADGGRIKTYIYEIEALDEEGLHLRRSKEGKDADYALVLAPEKGWLPVRIERRYGGHLWQMEWVPEAE